MNEAEMKTVPAKIGFVSLGCPKATVDSERILTRLRAEGYGFSSDYEGADLVVVNTCGFVDDAVEESLESIGEAVTQNGNVVVTGCLGARSELIRARYPQVLAVTGPHALEEVMRAVHEHAPPSHDPYTSLIPPQGIRLTPRHYAYLKISEGCNHRCTFCIIPQLRGDLVSRPIGDIMREAASLIDAGVRELLIVSQDTSAYGADIRYRTGFWNGRPLATKFIDLVRALGELGVWVRLHYVYPYPHVDEVIPLMADGRVLPYLDIPFQHASLRILRAMKRPAASENTLRRIEAWRGMCPDLAIRSTFIVGFPGESDADFSELLEFLRAAELDRVGCFAYSPVDGAPANALSNPVPEEIKHERRAQLMALQAEISAKRLARKVGRRMTVLADALDDRGLVARSPADAPEIDGVVYVNGVSAAKIGEFLDVEIVASDEHDLYARSCNA
jgi:ribosomal protein S12 methylthiotransferase